MAILHDKERRDALRAAQKHVRDLLDPAREARKIKAAAARVKRERMHLRAEDQRQPRVLEKGYLAFLRRQPCEARHLGGCGGRIDPAHIRFSDPSVGRINPGLGRKSDDKWCLSLCRTHHDAQHARGNERAWWSEVGVDPNARALEQYSAYLSGGVHVDAKTRSVHDE